MSTASIPRLLRPTRWHPRLPSTRPATLRPQQIRHVSSDAAASSTSNTTTKPKPLVLEKPARFNPPSHGSRLPKGARPRNYGAPLTEAQRTKRYPHMMPAEGTVAHKFLTNRGIHLWISLSTLLTLALYVFHTNWTRSTPYQDLLPPTSTFWRHPLAYLSRYAEVYKLHAAYVTARTQERRRRKVDDVAKRAEYRRAHGLEKPGDETSFGGWTAREDAEVLGPGMRSSASVSAASTAVVAGAEGVTAPVERVEDAQEEGETYRDFEGRKRPVKKWLGIW